MKISDSLTYLLIVVILSCTSTQGYAQHMCTNQDGPSTKALKIKSSTETLKECAQTVQIEFIQEMSKHRDGNLDTAFALYCTRVPTLKNCLRQFIDTVSSCQDRADERASLNLLHNIGASLLQYVCDNSKLLEKGYKKQCDPYCMAAKSQGIAKCSQNLTIAGHNTGTPNYSGASDNPLEAIQELKISSDEEGCRLMKTFQECSVKAVGDRDDQIYSEILDSLFKYINNDIPCANLPKAPKSNASLTSVVNVLLLLIPVIGIAL